MTPRLQRRNVFLRMLTLTSEFAREIGVFAGQNIHDFSQLSYILVCPKRVITLRIPLEYQRVSGCAPNVDVTRALIG
jgi:hypothetical protein